jgi:ribosomal protein S8E
MNQQATSPHIYAMVISSDGLLFVDGNSINLVRTRGGNEKRRALRLDTGVFSWGSEGTHLNHHNHHLITAQILQMLPINGDMGIIRVPQQ